MEHEKLAKSHGILLSVMEFYQFCRQNVPNLYAFCHPKKLGINVKSLYFPMFSIKCSKCKIAKRDGHGRLISGHEKIMEKSWKSHGKVMEKSWKRMLSSLCDP